MRKILIGLILASFSLNAGASTPTAKQIEHAKELYAIGEYADAVGVLEQAASREPRNKALNNLAGMALLRVGNIDRAVKFLSKGNNESLLGLAEIEFLRYNFSKASDYLEEYDEAQHKAKKPIAPEAEALNQRIILGSSLLDRVERIEIIDSLNVDRDTFFQFYKLEPSAGSISDQSSLPEGFTAAPYTTVYLSESGDNLLWADSDADENYVLVSSSQLADGSWEKPHPLGSQLNEGGDANFPFLMTDGVTLYFANDGENSLGGYDIFITRRDGNKYLQPQNIGMPYNSPYDDYLLAIDEQTGVGWWASERNQLQDEVTIYIFKPQELRINYPVDEPRLASLARVDAIRDSWAPGADYTPLLQHIEEIKGSMTQHGPEFFFALSNRRVYTSYNDFRSPVARRLMKEYVDLQHNIQHTQDQLNTLRAEYRAGKTDNSRKILSLEDNLERMRVELLNLSNQIQKAEP